MLFRKLGAESDDIRKSNAPGGFVCQQRSHCCLNLGAYQTCATEVDIALWEKNGRDDILEWVLDIAQGVYDIWMRPETGDYVSRPWLRKLPRQEKYICRIQTLKPEKCKDYPVSKEHAEETGCPGFGQGGEVLVGLVGSKGSVP